MARDPELLRAAPDAIAGELAAASSDAVRIELLPYRSVLNVRGPATETFVHAVERQSGVALPLAPNRWNGSDRRAAIWLGPDEWLLAAPDGEARALETAIRDACPDEPWLSVVDVSHNYTSFALSGPGTRELLAGGCPLDLHPAAFGAGRCAQTLLAKTRVLLRALDDGNAIELWVRNSFARYTAQWLLASSAEPEVARTG
ncbi:MAG TPA: sarcosine oxidase subunit gamma family protein [Woeseiaceae bacterium]|nr:sarcosine oxidase subunit gamma family protein [Woeseiaceae bacterium]